MKGEAGMTCPFCGGKTFEDIGNMTLSVADQIMIIEGVPAKTCNSCMEQFYGEDTLFKVEQLRAGRFQGHNAKRIAQVPVFAWEDLKKD